MHTHHAHTHTPHTHTHTPTHTHTHTHTHKHTHTQTLWPQLLNPFYWIGIQRCAIKPPELKHLRLCFIKDWPLINSYFFSPSAAEAGSEPTNLVKKRVYCSTTVLTRLARVRTLTPGVRNRSRCLWSRAWCQCHSSFFSPPLPLQQNKLERLSVAPLQQE